MRFAFATNRIRRLYDSDEGAHRYPVGVAKAFFGAIQWIKGSADETELYGLKGLHCEKLKGGRNEHSIRLNDQWRLTFTIEKDDEGKYILVLDIVDYHKRKRNA